MYKTTSDNKQRTKGIDRSSYSREAERLIKRENDVSKVFWEIKDSIEKKAKLPSVPYFIKKEIKECNGVEAWVKKNLKTQKILKQRKDTLAQKNDNTKVFKSKRGKFLQKKSGTTELIQISKKKKITVTYK
ncbi:MAG: hypothetical protein ACYDAI_17045 [Trichloromonadaceae bacterium]